MILQKEVCFYKNDLDFLKSMFVLCFHFGVQLNIETKWKNWGMVVVLWHVYAKTRRNNANNEQQRQIT